MMSTKRQSWSCWFGLITRDRMTDKEVHPIALSQIDKVAKANLSPGMRLDRNAKVALHRAAHVFVLYAATLADDERKVAGKAKRATLLETDVTKALHEAGFDPADSAVGPRKRDR